MHACLNASGCEDRRQQRLYQLSAPWQRFRYLERFDFFQRLSGAGIHTEKRPHRNQMALLSLRDSRRSLPLLHTKYLLHFSLAAGGWKLSLLQVLDG